MRSIELILLSIVLVIFGFTRLPFLDSGVLIVEPDEWSYHAVTESLKTDGYPPKIVGTYFFDQVPSFEFFSLPLSYLFPNEENNKNFLPQRIISVVASAGTLFLIYFFLRKKFNFWYGFFGGLFFLLVPLSLFYSKVGLRESLLIFGILSFFIAFQSLKDSGGKNLPSKIIFTAATLTFAIFSKLSGLILLGLPFLYFLTSFFKKIAFARERFGTYKLDINLNSLKNIKKEAVPFLLVFLIPIILTFLVFLPYYFINKLYLKDRLSLLFFSHNIIGTIGKLITAKLYLENLVFWLTIPFLIFSIAGIGVSLRKRKGFWFDGLFISFLISIFLSANDFNPRYFVLTIPILTLFAGYGLGEFVFWLKKIKISPVAIFFLVVALYFIMLPQTKLALDSTNHSLLEQTNNFLQKEKGDIKFSFSTFWPEIIQYKTGFLSSWITDSGLDANRPYSYLPNYSPKFDHPPANLIADGLESFVLVLEPGERDMFSERKRAVIQIEKKFEPLTKITDNKPNFPWTKNPYSLVIYKTTKEYFKRPDIKND